MVKICILSFFLLTTTLCAKYQVGEIPRAMALRLNDYLINCQFNAAYRLTDSLLVANPQEPLFYYLKVASIGLKSLDYDEPLDRTVFHETYSAGMQRIHIMEKSDHVSCDLVMIEGLLQSAYAAYRLLDGKVLSGLNDGRHSMKLLEEARECDPTNYDAEYYLGFYRYSQETLKKRFKGLLFWMPVSPGKGVSALEQCVTQSRFMNKAAEMILVDIHARAGQYQKVEAMLPELIERYPESRFLLWTKMRYHLGLQDTSKAVQAALDLSRRYLMIKAYHNGVVTAHEAAKMLGKNANLEELRKQFVILDTMIDESQLSQSDLRTWDILLNDGAKKNGQSK